MFTTLVQQFSGYGSRQSLINSQLFSLAHPATTFIPFLFHLGCNFTISRRDIRPNRDIKRRFFLNLARKEDNCTVVSSW